MSKLENKKYIIEEIVKLGMDTYSAYLIAECTEDQIKQLLDNHQFVGAYETITEDQLRGISMTDGLKRWANKDYSLSVMKVATAAIADAIARAVIAARRMLAGRLYCALRHIVVSMVLSPISVMKTRPNADSSA